MKTKITFLSLALLAISFTAHADVIYDAATYAVEQSGTTVTGAITAIPATNSTLTVNGKDAQFTTVIGGEVATLTFPNNLSFSYTNSSAGKKYVKFTKDGYIRPEGKDLILKLSGLTAGDKIAITDNGGSGGTDYIATGIAEGETVTIAASAVSTFTATGSEVTIKTAGGKYYISKIEVTSAGANLDEVASNKTVASVASYDVLGRPVAVDAKGLVITKTVYADGTSVSVKNYR